MERITVELSEETLKETVKHYIYRLSPEAVDIFFSLPLNNLEEVKEALFSSIISHVISEQKMLEDLQKMVQGSATGIEDSSVEDGTNNSI